MNALAQCAFARVTSRLEMAKALHQEATESGEPALIGLAYSEVLLASGELAAALQLLELDDIVAKSKAEGRAPLRLVR